MKKALALALAACLSLFFACSYRSNTDTRDNTATTGVELRFVHMFGGGDVNAQNMDAAIAAYERESGNTVNAEPGISSEEWKARVHMDFVTGSDPDVLQYFAGADSDPIIGAGKIVSLDEIRAVYPDFCSNINEKVLEQLASPVDGRLYCVPTNGFWEGIFCNKDVLDANGIAIPETWDDFIAACKKLKAAGVASFAVAVNNAPHYTFEFLVYNYSGKNHNAGFVPKTAGDAAYDAYLGALNDFKLLYDGGFLPENTLTAVEVEAIRIFNEKKAAFLAGGQWNLSAIMEDNTNLGGVSLIALGPKDSSVNPYPSFIGGYSTGIMITRKCWDDPDKRDAAVSLVESVLSDENIARFAGATLNPSKNPAPFDTTPFERMCVETVGQAKLTGFPVQDSWSGDASAFLFNRAIGDVCQGKLDPRDALAEFMRLNAE